MVKPKRTIKDHFKPITTTQQQNDNKNNNKPSATEPKTTATRRTTTRVTTSKTSPTSRPRTTTLKTSPKRTSISTLPKSSKTIKKNHTPSPHSSSSLSSLSSLDDNPTPTKRTTKTRPPTIQNNKNDHHIEIDDDDDDDDDDELPDHDFALPTKRKTIQTKPQKPDPKTNTPHQKSPSPSSSFNPARRRSSRLVPSTSKPSPSISIGSGSKTMIKLNKPAGPAKFSLEDILKDRRIRSEKQANLKRTREALGVSQDNEQTPDELLASNDPLLTPQKKSKTNSSHHDSKTVNGLDSICAQDPSTPPKAMIMLSDRTADLIISPSKAILLDEKDIDRFQSALDTQSTAHKPKIHKILRDDLVSGKLSGLNRGLNYRQLFHPNLLNPESTANPPPPSLPRIDYCGLEGVSRDPEVIEFVQELIDNLEYSIRHPDALPIDLTRVIPESLTNGTLEDESGTMIMTHKTIFGMLFRPLINPEYPAPVARKAVVLIEALLATLSATPSLNRLHEFWLSTLQDGLCQLGLLPHLVFFGNYSNQDPARLESSNPSFAFTLTTATERFRLVLKLFTVLSSASYLNDRGRIWALTIALRVGVEPTSSSLRADVMEVISHVITTVYHGSSGEQSTKETKISLLVETLKVAIDLHTWTNQLDLVRLFPAHLPFRKALVIGVVNLAVGHLDAPPPVQEEGLYKMARWLAHITNRFTTDPPTREIFNTLKERSRRPYEPAPLASTVTEPKSQEDDPMGATQDSTMSSLIEIESTKKPIKEEKFRPAFAGYLGSEDAINEAQFSALVLLFQTLTMGLWDFLIDPKNLPMSKPPAAPPSSNPTPPASFSSAPLPPADPSSSSFEAKLTGNVWITLVHQALESLDHSIKSCTSPHHQADRIKLKNIIFRLATALDFLNRESFLIAKGMDFKGQFKLDRFLKKS
ncbi:hypothetical protein PGTUg99_026692 [Puccinia graminis f. sp. tritici]|uniref:Uncharacterized protein n=1 Tax=Puccinia graminis f. sp. tritici TaxID=56615 RepID=A0A5B0SKJ1_PUCGR|nr:hypothetical protein PGTUg99_026692 [Puccinia graminis f. sp. tritici]